MVAPAAASAEGWSGAVSLDYTSENWDHFAGTVAISDTEFLGGPARSTPPDVDLDGRYAWLMHGSVAGDYTLDFNACHVEAEPDPKLEKRPAISGDYTYNQGLLMFGPPKPTSGTYILGNLGLHLTGTQQCDPDPTLAPYEDTGVPFPDLESDNEGRPIHPLNLRLPIGEAKKSKGGALNWQGTKSYTHQGVDPDQGIDASDNGPATGLKTAIWDYDLRYEPFDPAGCTLRAKNKQHLLDGVVAFKVVGDEGGCKATLKSAKVKIGKRGGGSLTNKTPTTKVGNGSDWAVVIPYSQKLAQRVFDALRAGKKVRAKAAFGLNGEKRSVGSKIVK